MTDRTDLDARLARLRAVDPRALGGVHAFDATLSEVMALDDPRAFAPLTTLFIQEEGGHEHAMWSLIHAVEHLGAQDGPGGYAAHFLAALPSLCRTAPRWAAKLLMRTLNSTPYTTALRDRIHAEATPDEMEAITALARSIDRVSPEFHEKTRQLGLGLTEP